MKKRVFVMVVVVVAVMGIVNAQTTQQKAGTTTSQPAKTLRACFVDKNNNGTCDNYESGICKTGNGKGIVASRGGRSAISRNDGQQAPGNRIAMGQRRGGRNGGQGLRDGSGRANGGRGANFVDANKNGVCDRRE